MPDLSFLTVFTVIAITGCGLMAGLFFVFSVSVMDALAQIRPQEGMKAMQLINRTILNPVFLSAFFVTAIACVCIIVFAAIRLCLRNWRRSCLFAWRLLGDGIVQRPDE